MFRPGEQLNISFDENSDEQKQAKGDMKEDKKETENAKDFSIAPRLPKDFPKTKKEYDKIHKNLMLARYLRDNSKDVQAHIDEKIAIGVGERINKIFGQGTAVVEHDIRANNFKIRTPGLDFYSFKLIQDDNGDIIPWPGEESLQQAA